MKLNKKKFILSFAFALIISALIFVIADPGYLFNTNGLWVNYEENAGLTSLTLNANQLGGYPNNPIIVALCNPTKPDVCSGGAPVASSSNIVKTELTEVNAPAGPIYFEVYEKDATVGEDGIDDSIRVGSNRLVGVIRDNQIAIAPWAISLQDIVASGEESDNTYEFYFKAITPEGYEKIYNAILSVNVIWTGNVVDGDWYDKNLVSPIESVNVDAIDLLEGEKSGEGASNLVYMKAETNGANSGIPVVFQILDDEQTEIRTGLDSIVGPVTNNFANAAWRINLEDMEKAQSNLFYFRAQIGQTGTSIAKYLLVNVDYTNLMANLIPNWLDFNLNEISSISFNWNDLSNQTASQSNSVYLYIKGLGPTSVDKNLNVEIWEKDDIVSNDDPIRTGSKALTGAVNANGELKVLWTLNQADILNAETENPYDFYYKIIVGKHELSFRDNSLRVDITGMQGINISESQGVWKNRVGSTITQITWQNDTTNNEVVPYVTNINAPQGTIITFEIWEKDAIGGDDAIRTVSLGNALSDDVNNLGQAYPLWVITQSDLDAAASDDGGNNPTYEFYFKIKYDTQEKTFDNVILEVQIGQSTCININYCIDYMDDASCNQDVCDVANATGLNYGIDCTIFGVNCGCSWNIGSSQCNFIYSNGSTNNYGSCEYLESGNDSCSDGVLTLLWSGNWTWATGNNFVNQTECENSCGVGNCTQDLAGWHCDPDSQSTQCTSTSNSNSISCPAKVQLPGFNWLNIVFIVIALVIIYFLIAWRRKKVRTEKRKK